MTAALRDQKAEAEPQGGDAATRHSDQKEQQTPAAETAEAPAAEGGNDETNDAPAGTAGTES
jgi:hypothetical protein